MYNGLLKGYRSEGKVLKMDRKVCLWGEGGMERTGRGKLAKQTHEKKRASDLLVA